MQSPSNIILSSQVVSLLFISLVRQIWLVRWQKIRIMLKLIIFYWILIFIVIVHRRKKSRDRRYKQSHLYKCMLFCACGFCPKFARCNRKIHKNGNIQSSKLFPTLGICLGMLIGIGMTLYSDPFLLFRTCRGKCDDYR